MLGIASVPLLSLLLWFVCQFLKPVPSEVGQDLILDDRVVSDGCGGKMASLGRPKATCYKGHFPILLRLHLWSLGINEIFFCNKREVKANPILKNMWNNIFQSPCCKFSKQQHFQYVLKFRGWFYTCLYTRGGGLIVQPKRYCVHVCYAWQINSQSESLDLTKIRHLLLAGA